MSALSELGGMGLTIALVLALYGIGEIVRYHRKIKSHRRKGSNTMGVKLIVIATTKEAAIKKYPNAAAVVTPKSPHAARGMTGKVIVMDAMRQHDKLHELLVEVAPCDPSILVPRDRQVETVKSLAPTRKIGDPA